MGKHIISIVAFVLISGCVTLTPQEIEANKKRHCADLGAPEGSKNYYDCRKDLEHRLIAVERIEQQANAQRAQQQQEFWRGERERLAAQQNAFQPMQYQPPVRQNMNCRSYMVGNAMNTDCN